MNTIIIRHRRENLKKCSLRGLELEPGFLFFSYPLKANLPDMTDYVLLSIDAPLLSSEDSAYGLVLLDATWRLASRMERGVPFPPTMKRRSLPQSISTAYPRRQDDCPFPSSGLASIEALFAAFSLLGRNTDGLLEGYHWRQPFLEKNRHLL